MNSALERAIAPFAGLGLLWLGALAAAAVAACSPGPAATDGGSRRLSFTAIPDSDTTELARRFAPLADYLAERLDLEVRYVPATDYEASVSMFETGDVQLAWFGGLSGAQARAAVPGSRAIAQGAVDPQFKTYFIANAELGLEPSSEFPSGLEGVAEFTFGSPQSTSGRLMPEHAIRLHTGRSPAEFFGAPPAYSGSHDRTWKNVQDGVAQAGALNYKTYERALESGELDPARVTLLWETPPFADYNWSVRGDLDERFGAGTTDALQRALVELDDPELLRAMDRADLIPASNADFDALAALARELGFL